MTLERAIELVLAEADRFEQNAQMLARDAQDPEGKCMSWANAYREKAQALRMVAHETGRRENMIIERCAEGH